MTPDWAAKPTSVPYANFGNPQSLNLYGYVQNNPTTMGDPDGHCTDPLSCGAEFAGIGTLIEPGGGTLVGAAIGGIVGSASCTSAAGQSSVRYITRTMPLTRTLRRHLARQANPNLNPRARLQTRTGKKKAGEARKQSTGNKGRRKREKEMLTGTWAILTER